MRVAFTATARLPGQRLRNGVNQLGPSLARDASIDGSRAESNTSNTIRLVGSRPLEGNLGGTGAVCTLLSSLSHCNRRQKRHMVYTVCIQQEWLNQSACISNPPSPFISSIHVIGARRERCGAQTTAAGAAPGLAGRPTALWSGCSPTHTQGLVMLPARTRRKNEEVPNSSSTAATVPPTTATTASTSTFLASARGQGERCCCLRLHHHLCHQPNTNISAARTGAISRQQRQSVR